MLFATWKTETSRGLLTPRSRQLKALDTAFQLTPNTATCTPQQKVALANLLKAWMDAQALKGQNWRQSTRNSQVDVHGRGTVEQLARDLMQDLGARPILAAYVNAPAPVAPPAPPVAANNAYAPGRWDRSKDRDGHWYDFIRQEKGNSCVCATIAMVKRSVHNLSTERLSEEEIRGLMALEETGQLNTGVSSLSHQAQTGHDWDNVGTSPARAVSVLKRQPYPVLSARRLPGAGGQQLLDEIRKFTANAPGLIGWRWAAGGGHFTMCTGPTRDGASLVIVDPWTGIGYVDNTLAGFTSYNNGQGTLGVAIASR